MARQCPIDARALEAVRVQLPGPDIIVDRCDRCHGTWVDEKEVWKVTGSKDLVAALGKYRNIELDGRGPCPNCKRPMGEEAIDGVRVDVCMICRGVWFDQGEIDKLRGFDADALHETEDTRSLLARGLGKVAAKLHKK